MAMLNQEDSRYVGPYSRCNTAPIDKCSDDSSISRWSSISHSGAISSDLFWWCSFMYLFVECI